MTALPPLRVLVADDHAAFRQGLCELLARQPDFEVVGEASDGADASARARALRPHGLDLVLMDVDMPRRDGIEATAEITSTDPDLPIVILTVSTLDYDLFAALRCGAVGFLNKHLGPQVLLRTLRDFRCNGSLPMSRQIAAKALAYFQQPRAARHSVPVRDGEANLTRREWEVLGMIAAGARDREIGATLQVGETTVKTHVRSILRKLQARNRAEAAARFRSGARVDSG